MMAVSRFKLLLGNRLLSTGLISLVIKVAGAGLSYLMFVAFARMLSAEDYGVFAFSFNLAIVISAFAGFGYSTAILRYWPQYMAQGRPEYAKGVIRMGSMLSFAGVAIILLASLVIDQVTGARLQKHFLGVAILASTFCFGDFAAGVLRAQHSVVGSMLPRDVLWRILAPLAAATLIWLGYGLNSANAIYVSAAMLGVLLLGQILLIFRSTARLAGPAEAVSDWAGTRDSLLPLWGAGIVFAMIQQMDVVVVGYLMNGAETGAYFAAQKTATLLSLVLIAGGLVTAPIMASLYEKRDHAALQKLCKELVLAIAVVTFLGFVFLVFAGNLLLSFFNPSFTSAYGILLILAFGCMIDAVSGPTAYLMQMTSYEKAYLKIMVICYLLVIALQFALIPRYGGIGAALASASGTVIWNLWSIALLRTKAALDPSILGLVWPAKRKGS
ncbi:MAG: oligosaccharide flippase family protein [Alphaproteobacteria bacterium]|nr:oligosaccharide flippase family protein [Alphaproteobacteria bacterium]